MAPPRPIRACIFDMDGLLVNTEDLITASLNEILHTYGRPSLPWHMKAQLVGVPLKRASEIFLQWSGLPLTSQEYERRLMEVHRRMFPTSQPLPGVMNLLQRLSTAEDVEIALATTSGRERFELKTGHLGELFTLFPLECQVLGDDPRIPPGKGKPEPDIYLVALATINNKLKREGKPEVTAGDCLVFEDSVVGVEAGRRAGMQVVWCPHAEILREYETRVQNVLAGRAIGVVDDERADRAEEEVLKQDGSTDGWARLILTLEDFPSGDYGLLV